MGIVWTYFEESGNNFRLEFCFYIQTLPSFHSLIFCSQISTYWHQCWIVCTKLTRLSLPASTPFLTSFASLHLVTLVWSWRPVTWSLLHIGLTKSGHCSSSGVLIFRSEHRPSSRRNFQRTEPVELWRGCGAFVLAPFGRRVFPNTDFPDVEQSWDGGGGESCTKQNLMPLMLIS